MSTAVTKVFLTRSFAPGETIGVLLRRENPASTKQRIVTLEQVLAPRYLAWLQYQNYNGSNVYVTANPLHPGSRRRTKECIAEVRHLYIDIDVDGAERIARILSSDAVPIPSAVLSTSPGKYQVLWRVQGFDFDQQENMLKLLAIAFGGDSACTDRNRVLRVPGFRNCKYSAAVPITVEYLSDSTHHPSEFHLDDQFPVVFHSQIGVTRSLPTRKNTASEQDWSWALRQLSLGQDAEDLTVQLAARRSDKPNPLYYAQRTIDIAFARLSLVQGTALESVIATLERRRSNDVSRTLSRSRACEIAATAQRMIARSKVA